VLSWKTKIAALRDIEAGEGVSYNATFRAARKTRIALLPVGYADGYNRLLSNHGDVLLHGQHAPIAGRVTMDQTMIDVTDIPEAAIGDEVVLLGVCLDGRSLEAEAHLQVNRAHRCLIAIEELSG
jgi:alanine racemase